MIDEMICKIWYIKDNPQKEYVELRYLCESPEVRKAKDGDWASLP